MGTQLEMPETEIREGEPRSKILDSMDELAISSNEIKRCARLFDKYNRPDCALFFVELLVTPSSDRAEKVLYFSSDLWRELQSGALTGKVPSLFELDQFRADCKELSQYLVRLSEVARLAPEPYCDEVNRWLGIFGPFSSSSTRLN